MINCDCIATPTKDHLDYNIFNEVFPDGIPIKPIAFLAKIKTIKDRFWEVDKSRLTSGQKAFMLDFLSQRFNLPKEEVVRDMEDPKKKFPLRDRGLIFSFCRLHSRILMSS